MMNRLQTLHPSVLFDKWRFDLIQDWETFALDFKSFSTDTIPDKTLRALGFRISATGYLEKGSLHFTDITDLELNAEPAVVDNPGQVVTDFKKEVVKKKNKSAVKRKERLAKLRALVGSPLSTCPKSSSLLSLCLIPTPMSALMSALLPSLITTPIPAPIFCSESPAVLSSCRIPALVSRLGFSAVMLSCCLPVLAGSADLSSFCHTPVFCCRIPALLLPLPSVLSPPFILESSPFRTFKRSLSDEPWPRVLSSPAKPLRLFLAFDTYNPDDNNGSYNSTNNNERKRGFNTTFINSRPLAGNHDQEEIDLSFAGCRYLDTVKLNRSWQLDLFDPKPVCIIKAIPLAIALFSDPTFAPYPCHTMKLAFKLGLRTNKIISGVVKERIETIWANRIVSLLNRLFRDNPK